MYNKNLTAKDVADWLALNPDTREVLEALARAFGQEPLVSKDGTIGFDTGIPVSDVFFNEDHFREFCEDFDDSEHYY